MNIVIISNSAAPSKNASSLQVSKLCEALSILNHKVTLILPNTGTGQNYFNFYNIDKKFKILRLKLFEKFPTGIRYYLFSLIAIFLLFFKSEKNKNLPIVFSLTIIIFASFIASNRMSFLILISLIVFLILFFKTFRKSLIISLVLLLPFFYYFYQTDSQVNHRYTQLVIKANKIINLDKFKNNSEQNFDISNSEIKTSKNLPNHSKIFNTSYKSFKDNFLIGNGVKSFRYNCKNYLNQKDTLCSTHPHNYHLEILHDTGLIGFSVLFIFTCLILWKSFRLFQDKRLSYKQKIILALIIANFLIEIFPLKSTGSIFTTWNGTLVWLSVALVNYGNHERYNKKF